MTSCSPSQLALWLSDSASCLHNLQGMAVQPTAPVGDGCQWLPTTLCLLPKCYVFSQSRHHPVRGHGAMYRKHEVQQSKCTWCVAPATSASLVGCSLHFWTPGPGTRGIAGHGDITEVLLVLSGSSWCHPAAPGLRPDAAHLHASGMEPSFFLLL